MHGVLTFICSQFLYAQSDREILNFDGDWLFNRYGLQADGTRIDEPWAKDSLGTVSPREIAFDDNDWRKLDVPHDWGIEGPFSEELDGYTGKLPWRGIGWYRKHFTIRNAEKEPCFS